MTHFDVFNGDADGICSLLQLRLSDPKKSRLITGIKRDIALLQKVDAKSGDSVTVLDISLDKNRQALVELLARDVKVHYFDHHFAGEIPQHPNLKASIDTSAEICTSLLVNDYLQDAFPAWAVVGAYGDNFDAQAEQLGRSRGLNAQQLGQLRQLGQVVNYNGYGASLADLHFAPDELFRKMLSYTNPLDFIETDAAFTRLSQGYEQDIAQTRALKPEWEDECGALHLLPGEAWARRVSGVFANKLAQANTGRAHALLTRQSDGYLVSVRAPLDSREGADELCRQFPTGGGRKAAAGINQLPAAAYESFVEAFRKQFAKH